ncbi:MAG: hypothetical protein ABJ360_22420 [Roseobacter sp.]
MSTKKIKEKIEAISKETGLQKTTIGQMACKDAKLHERAVRRVQHEQSVMDRLEAFRLSYSKKVVCGEGATSK